MQDEILICKKKISVSNLFPKRHNYNIVIILIKPQSLKTSQLHIPFAVLKQASNPISPALACFLISLMALLFVTHRSSLSDSQLIKK